MPLLFTGCVVLLSFMRVLFCSWKKQTEEEGRVGRARGWRLCLTSLLLLLLLLVPPQRNSRGTTSSKGMARAQNQHEMNGMGELFLVVVQPIIACNGIHTQLHASGSRLYTPRVVLSCPYLHFRTVPPAPRRRSFLGQEREENVITWMEYT